MLPIRLNVFLTMTTVISATTNRPLVQTQPPVTAQAQNEAQSVTPPLGTTSLPEKLKMAMEGTKRPWVLLNANTGEVSALFKA